MRRAPLAITARREEGGHALALSLLVHAAAAAAIIAGLGAGKGLAPEPPGEGAVVTVMFAAAPAAPTETLAPFDEPDAPIFPADSVVTEAPPAPIAPMPEPDTAALPPLPAPPTPAAQATPTQPPRAQPQPARAQQRPAARAQPRAAPASHAAGAAPTGGAEPAGGNDALLPILATNPGFRSPPRPPAYPQAAVARGLEGTVLVRVLIAPDGTTREVVLHRSSGIALLDRAALEAVRHWAFKPASVGGRVVAAWVEVPVRFRLG